VSGLAITQISRAEICRNARPDTELHETYRLAESAHYEIDRINHLVSEKDALMPEEGMTIPVQDEDQLLEAVETVRRGISALRSALDSA